MNRNNNNKPVFLLFVFLLPLCMAVAENQKSELLLEQKLLPYGFTDRIYERRKSKESSPMEQTNPLKLFFVMLIRTYQVVFSSQDGSTCQFRPSCSHYGVQAIKQYGIQGVLMASDRLLRCNPYTEGKYPTSDDRVHLHDPVKDHTLW